LEEAGRNHGSLLVILNGDDRGFRMQRTVTAFEQNAVGKFQRAVDREEDLAGGAEFDDRILDKDVLTLVLEGGVFADAWLHVGAAKLDGNSYRRGFGKKPGQTAYEFGFERARSCVAGQVIETSTPELKRASLLSPWLGSPARTPAALAPFSLHGQRQKLEGHELTNK
jgi:hypothetical protein